jgi:hypothetical protein
MMMMEAITVIVVLVLLSSERERYRPQKGGKQPTINNQRNFVTNDFPAIN